MDAGVRTAALIVVALSGAVMPPELAAQWVESPLLRRGQVSAFITPFLTTWDERYGLRADGTEALEAAGSDFTRSVVDADMLPGLTGIQQRFADLLQDSAATLNLGSAHARVFNSINRIPVGASVGVFDWLTVGGVVPFVKRRVELDFLVNGVTANTGVSPGSDAPEVVQFIGQANAALASIMNQVDATCAAVGETDPGCMSGRAFAAETSSFFSELEAAYGGQLFLFGLSDAGKALSARVNEVRSQMHNFASDAGIDTTFTADLPFATAQMTAEQFQGFVTDGAFGIGGDPLTTLQSLWEMGDVEVFAAVRLLGTDRDPASDVEPLSDSLPAPGPSDQTLASDSLPRPTSRLGYLLGVQTTYRLGTGVPARAQNRLDLGSGDGLDDVEVKVFGRLDYGKRFRARVEAVYGVQMAGERLTRVYQRDAPFALQATEAVRSVDPGDYRSWMIAPEVRLTPELSVGARYRSYHQGADTYDTTTTPEADAILLSAETEVDLSQWGVGVSFWPSLGSAESQAWPMAVTGEYLVSASGAGGQVPSGGQLRIQLRLFVQAW